MPVGDAARFQAENGNVDDLAAVQRDQAMRRAHELHRGRAVGELVAHHFGDGQLGYRFLQRELQAGGERDARNRLLEEGIFGIAFDPALELIRRGAFLFQAFGERRARLAVGAERDFGRHQFLRLGPVRSLWPHVLDEYGQPARRGEDPRVARGSRSFSCARISPSRSRKPNASPKCFSAFGGSSSVNSSTSRFAFMPLSRSLQRRPSAPARSMPRRLQLAPAGTSGNPGAGGNRNTTATRCAPGCGCGRCRRRAR